MKNSAGRKRWIEGSSSATLPETMEASCMAAQLMPTASSSDMLDPQASEASWNDGKCCFLRYPLINSSVLFMQNRKAALDGPPSAVELKL